MRELKLSSQISVHGPLVKYNETIDSFCGSIVVVESAEYFPSIYRAIQNGAIGICAESGSLASHGAIAAKELGIITVICHPTDRPEFGKSVTLHRDGYLSTDIGPETKLCDLTFPSVDTLISINLGFPQVILDSPEIVNFIDLIGFVRLEFMLSDLLKNRHPLSLTKAELLEVTFKLTENLRILAQTNKPVWIRTDDFSPNQLLKYSGYPSQEIWEENPMLGFRGISRSISETGMIEYQFIAIANLISEGYSNVGIFPPMTRTINEYMEWRRIANKCGVSSDIIKFGLMVETPSVAYELTRFCPLIDFVVVGTNDLTQFIMAADRSNPNLHHLFDINQNSVFGVIKNIVETCSDFNLPCVIGGVEGSNASVISQLMEYGPIIPSVNPSLVHISRMRNSLGTP